jgi:hypothetical protein
VKILTTTFHSRVKRFHHEEQREGANEYWERREADRFRPLYLLELPPAPPLTAKPFDWGAHLATRQLIQEEENARSYTWEELGIAHLKP